jgi:hypothetical protein
MANLNDRFEAAKVESEKQIRQTIEALADEFEAASKSIQSVKGRIVLNLDDVASGLGQAKESFLNHQSVVFDSAIANLKSKVKKALNG